MTRILVVDDMAVFREPIAAALRMQGFEVDCAEDGQQALQAMAHTQPDLVLLDVAMPKMNGLALLAAMRDDPELARLPVILLTAIQDKDQVLRAARFGVRDYLLKTQFSLKELVARIRKRLDAEVTDPASADPPQADPSEPTSTAGQASASSEPAGADTSSRERASSQLPPSNGSAGDDHAAATAAANAPTDSRTAPAPESEDEDDAGTSDASSDEDAPNLHLSPAPDVAGSVNALPDDASVEDSLNCLRELKPLLSRSEITEVLEACGELKAISPIVNKVIRMTQSRECSLERVSKCIRQDHAIALKILKLANSSIYSRGEPVESVHKAVMRIGMNNIRQAVCNLGVIERFSGTLLDGTLSMPLFWEHSIATGLIAAEIAHELEWSESAIESAFTMGLLHDVGRVVYAEMMPDRYAQVLTIARRLRLPVEQVESRLLLVNHSDAMDRVLHAWRFPRELVNPIALHHLSVGNIRRMCPKMVEETTVLALANRLAHGMLLGTSGNSALYAVEEFVQALRINETFIARLEADIPDQTHDLKFAMLTHMRAAAWPQLDRQLRKQIGLAVRPVHVSVRPGIDVFRMAFDRLRDPGDLDDEGQDDSPAPPNLAVVHIANLRERSELADKLAKIEREAGCNRLPLLVLSPGARNRLDDSIMQSRPSLVLPNALTLPRLVNALHRLLGSPPAANQHRAA